MRFLFAFLLLFAITPFANSQMGINEISTIEAECHSKIEADLCKYINSGESDMISINIILKSQMDQNSLRSVARKANDKKESRALVIDELKRFSKQNQADVLSVLTAEQRANNVTSITSHWIHNSINCTTTPDVIFSLAEHPDVLVISHNNDEKLIWDEESVDAEEGETRETTENVTQVNADDVWNLGYTGKGIVVAVIDSGVNYNHVDLKDHLWNGGTEYPHHGYDFANNDNDPMDDHKHGTHCAGTVCGDGTSGSKTGMAPDATLMCIKVLDEYGNGSLSELTSGVEFAIENGADVLSLSLGWCAPKVSISNSQRTIFNNVLEAGVIASVAAGNDGEYETYPRNINSPGNCPPPWIHPDQQANSGGVSSVVCVGAVDYDDDITYFSSRGPVTWQESDWKDYQYTYHSGLKNTNGWLHYDNGIYYTRIGNTITENINWGIMFPIDDMQPYKESSITKIALFDGIAHTGNILIYKGGNTAPETLIHTQAYTCTGKEEYIEIDLTNKIPINGDENIWVTLRNDNEIYVAAACPATHDKNGRWLSSSGNTWKDILDNLSPLQYSWMIRAYVEDNSSKNEQMADNHFGLIRPDICAPGYNIKSASNTNNTGFKYMSGTSMATPCVAGVMALMLDKDPTLTPADICRILETSAHKLTNKKSNETGSGRIDALAAIELIDEDEEDSFVPTNLTVSKIDDNKIKLEWDAVAQKRATTYNVYRNDVKIDNVSTTYCVIEGITHTSKDTYSVTALNNGSESQPSEPVTYIKSIGDSFIIDYANYSLQFTITSMSPNEVSVKCYTFPTVETELYIPNVAETSDGVGYDVVEIEEDAFYTREEGFIYSYDTSNKLSYFDGIVEIPENVRKIGQGAFQYCSIEHITLPNKITSIPQKCFYNCKCLTIQFHDNIKTIEMSAFFNCDELTTIVLPKKLETLGKNVFSGCNNLKSVIFTSDNIKKLDILIFNQCNQLKVVRFKSKVPGTITDVLKNGTFSYTSENLPIIKPLIYVDADVVDAYKAKWPKHKEYIVGLSTFVHDGDWMDESNWDVLPTGGVSKAKHVYIDANAVIRENDIVDITYFENTENGSITIEEGGQLKHISGLGSVNAKKSVSAYETYWEGNYEYLESGWHTISSPFKSLSVGQLAVGNHELFRYDEPTCMWENVKNSEHSGDFTSMERGRGYIYANEYDTELTLSGELNTGDVKCNLTASALDENLTGFNLIGNPYMHNIYKGTAIKNNKLKDGYYRLTGQGTWIPETDKISDSEPILPLQSILVQVTENTTVKITQTAENNSKRLSEAYIKLNVNNEQYEDVAYVTFSGSGLNKVDHRNENAHKLYIPVDNENYAIAVQDLDDTEIPVHLETKKMGEYTISLKAHALPYETIILRDNINGNKVDIKKGEYRFMATSSDRPDRFTLLIDYKDDAIIYSDNSNIRIENMRGNATIRIYDIKGNVVAHYNTSDYSCQISTENMSRSVYIVNVTDDNGSHTQKVVVR